MASSGESLLALHKFRRQAGAADPSGVDGNVRRIIDIHEDDTIDEPALKALIRAAVALDTSAAAKRHA
jgi:hypothetical protein